MTGRRVVSIFLPQFAMERWLRAMEQAGNAAPDDLPIALATEGPHGPVIHAINRTARQSGIQIGERVVDMRALCPALQVEYADLQGDRRLLDRLMLWARQWCPWTVTDGVNGLILDTTGSDHLFGGEAELLREIETRFALLGFSIQLAVAPTWGAAWALARFGPVRPICEETDLAARLAPLPVKSLRLTHDTVVLLHRLGLKTIADIAAIPRLSLARRFKRADLKDNPLLRLDQAMGRMAEPVSSIEEQPQFRIVCRLAEPIQDPAPYVPNLCVDLCSQFEAAGAGCRRLRLTVYRTDGEVSAVTVATSRPSRTAEHLARLFDGKLERINPGYGFDLITLEAAAIEPIALAQHCLDGGSDETLQLSHLIDRLTARYGPRSVNYPVLYESHVPERAQRWVAALDRTPGGTATVPLCDRPIRILEPPEEVRVLYDLPEGPPAKFVWRRQSLQVTRYSGPERIAPEWWKDRPGTRLRDYFKVEDQTGRRLWLYREGAHDDGRGGAPRWFLHGMFA